MAKKAVINPVLPSANSITAVNSELNKVNDMFDNTLSLDGSTPNSLGGDLDLNSNDILNAESISTATLTIGGILYKGNLSFEGDWVASTLYNINEIVSYSSVLYIAVEKHTSSNNFQNDVSGGKWIVFLTSEKGDTGDSGIIVSATQPSSPSVNDLWLDIS